MANIPTLSETISGDVYLKWRHDQMYGLCTDCYVETEEIITEGELHLPS